MVQVIGKALKRPARLLDLLQREVEQLCIVCLKLDGPALRQDLLIALQEFFRCQPPLGMPCLGPGIRKFR